jgi:dethiobiotin synthetase
MSAAERPRALFVTGTDTGVGKTLVTAALARHLTKQGLRLGVMKPVETGVTDVSRLGPDGELLCWASSNSRLGSDDISPYRLKSPLAPAVAASREQIRINYAELLEQARSMIAEHDFTLIEGAGGLMVPLAGGLLMADFAKSLEIPLLVVCRPNLGTSNHTLLTLFAARTMEVPLAGYLLNNMPAEQSVAEQTAPHSLASLTTEELLGVLPQVFGSEQDKVERLAQEIPAMPTYPLLSRYLAE